MKKLLFILLLFITCVTQAQWINGQNASYVLGASDFTSTGSITASGIAVDMTNNKLYAADNCNHVVRRYSLPITSNNQTPERTFGVYNTSGCTQGILNRPVSVAVDANGRLYVSDGANHRILYWDNAYSIASNGEDASGVIGQADYTSGSSNRGGSTTANSFNFSLGIGGLFGCSDSQTYGGFLVSYSGYLFVSDGGNNRILRFNSPTSGTADVVFGQSNFTSSSSGLSATKFDSPMGISVANGEYLYVADRINNRVLRFNSSISTSSNGNTANGVIGQPFFTSSPNAGLSSTTFDFPLGLVSDGKDRLYITDSNQGRLVTVDNASSVNYASVQAPFSNVLGASDFTSYNSTITQGEMYAGVSGIAVDISKNKLYVGNSGANRILVYSASSALPLTIRNIKQANSLVIFDLLNSEKTLITLEVSEDGKTFTSLESKFYYGGYNNKIDLPKGYSYFRLRQETNDETFWSDIKLINDSEVKYLVVGDELLIFDESVFIEYFIYDGSGALTTTGSTNKSIKFYTEKFVIIKCLVENEVFTIKLIK